MSKSRKFARWVAWNIDGSSMKKISRKSLKFKLDDRLDPADQAGDELYEGNRLDRGHIARSADLCWGSEYEAQKANRDSFYFTNITPQHERFNQSNRNPQSGIWGNLENAIFEDAQVENLKISVMGGPILEGDDLEYRGYMIPKSFWKVIYYREKDNWQMKAKAFILTQENLLGQLEALDLDDFKLYEVPFETLTRKTGLGFFQPPGTGIEAMAEVRKISTTADIAW
jgi:endonuclease G